MNVKKSKLSTIAIVSLLIFTMTAGICNAQSWSRGGKSELFGVIQQIGSEEVKYKLPPAILPVQLDIDNAFLYGVGYGYNMNDHWNINADLLFGSADTDVKVSNVTVETEDMDYVLFNVNLDYNLWKSRFTPLVTGGIGVMDFGIDTTASIGDVHDSDFSYNLGVGIRWDVEDDMFLKAVYRKTWTEFTDADADMEYDIFSLSIACMF